MDNVETTDITTQQPQLISRFKTAINQQELSHAYLLVGGQGSGKTQVALWVAMRLFCLHVKNGQPDLTCEECTRIQQHLHPDVLEINSEGQNIKVDQIRLLKSEFTKSAVEGSQKVFIVHDADKMTVSAANSLLKFLEEPSSTFTAFLLTTNKAAILPTIQSRTQIVELPPLNKDQFKQLLKTNGIASEVVELASSLTKSLDVVKDLTEDNWLVDAQQVIKNWFQLVVKQDMRAFVLIQAQLMKLADNRARQQVLLDMIMMVWRDPLMLKNDSTATINFNAASSAVAQAAQTFTNQQLTACCEETLATKRLLDQNVSFQNIVERLTILLIRILK